MRKFTEMSVCVRQQVCARCRDLEGGRKWREAIARRYVVDGTDWACPRGHAWGHAGISRGLGDTVAKVIGAATFGLVKPCGGCRKRRERLNRLVPYRSTK